MRKIPDSDIIRYKLIIPLFNIIIFYIRIIHIFFKKKILLYIYIYNIILLTFLHIYFSAGNISSKFNQYYIIVYIYIYHIYTGIMSII